MHYKVCQICGVRSGKNNGKKRLFMARFPLNDERCKQWVKFVGKEDLAYVPVEKLHTLKYVCGKHFKSGDFTKKKTQLKRTAIPSVDLRLPQLCDDVLIGFPLHVAKENIPFKSHCGSSTNITLEHNYCKLYTSHKRPHSPEPSFSTSKSQSMETSLNKKQRVLCDRESALLQSISQINNKNEQMPEPAAANSITYKSKSDSPQKKKLLRQLQNYKIINKHLKKTVKEVEKIESPVLKSLIQSTVKNQKRKPHGKRWSNLNKSVALAIYKKSPKSYKYLSQLLPMPSIRTLQSVLENMKMEPGINQNILDHLKRKAEQLSEKEKYCALLYDEIALKKRLIYNPTLDQIDGYEDLGNSGGRSERIADHALVFMLQGIYKKIKQPFSYYFTKGTISSENLANIINTNINAINSVGYQVLTTVCDQGPTNVGALNLLKKRSGLPLDHNYFLLNKEKIYIIYDVPHLFKSIRNNFLHAGVMMLNNKKAQWSHLIQVEEKNRMKLRFTKITKMHVAPKYRAKMRVKTAAQILSNTVAAILKLISENTENKEQSNALLQTAEVIELLDNLFDCNNGPASKNDVKKGIRTNVSKNSFHHQLWPKYKEILKTMVFLKSDSDIRLKNVRCINGYLITIKSLECIWEYVASKGFKYLNLRQLNQDALENLFGIIRQHSPTNRNPTCHHFKGALKSSILTRLSTPLSKGSNCEKDNNNVLFDFNDIVFPALKPTNQVRNSQSHDSSAFTSGETVPQFQIPDYILNKEMELEEINAFFKSFDKQPTVYVSGYLAYAVLKNISCRECEDSLTVSSPKEHPIYNYILLREWWNDKQSLTYPTIKLCETIDLATNIFQEEVLPCLYRQDLCTFVKTLMLVTLDFSWICESHRSSIVDELIQRLSLLLIRNECKIINISLAITEENLADYLKKAEQQGMAK